MGESKCRRKPEHPEKTYAVEESHALYHMSKPGIEPGTSEVIGANVTMHHSDSPSRGIPIIKCLKT